MARKHRLLTAAVVAAAAGAVSIARAMTEPQTAAAGFTNRVCLKCIFLCNLPFAVLF